MNHLFNFEKCWMELDVKCCYDDCDQLWLLILCLEYLSFDGREFPFDYCSGFELAYAGSSGLAFAGVGVANCRFAPGE